MQPADGLRKHMADTVANKKQKKMTGMKLDKVANKVAYMAPENRINWLTWNWTMSATMSNGHGGLHGGRQGGRQGGRHVQNQVYKA